MIEIFKNLFKIEDNIVTDLTILQQISRKTSFEECDEIDLFNRMRILVKSKKLWTDGLGLAAIQIGVDLSALYYEINERLVHIVNPIIIEENEKFIVRSEGCLSFPNQRIDTYRYKNIIVEADVRIFDKKNSGDIRKNVKFSADDLEAHILQHEIDHIFGKTIFDRAAKIVSTKRDFRKVGRNETCPFCNSGKKYKYCCLELNEASQNVRISESKE